MDKLKSSVYIMSVNEDGQNVYVPESDPSKSFIFDDDGNMMECPKMNLDLHGVLCEDSGHESLNAEMEHITDTPQLDMVANLELDYTLVEDFGSNLMEMNEDVEDDGCILQYMNIREPLSILRQLLEERLGVELEGYSFYLQNVQKLESHKTLVDQCVQGEGMVQVNVQIQPQLKRININDVLKSAEDYISTEEEPVPEETAETPPQNDSDKNSKVIVNWEPSEAFNKEMQHMNIPRDPKQWNELHVRHWIQWAIRQFNLRNIRLSDWIYKRGEDLYNMTLADFQKLVPNDPGDVFWTHVQLLRQLKLVAIVHDKPDENLKRTPKLMKQSKFNRLVQNYSSTLRYFDQTNEYKSGNSAQIQLWQFLLDLLTSREYNHIIHWMGEDGEEGEFKLSNPELVAVLWGERKNKPTMNYEKLSRALRYYYDGDMISKVYGKRFVYKFVCDLKQLLGYSALELSNLVKYGNPNTKQP